MGPDPGVCYPCSHGRVRSPYHYGITYIGKLADRLSDTPLN